MEKVNELVKEIRENLSQQGASQKDEVRVMRAMLNDKEYQVGIYDKTGLVDTYNPSSEARQFVASVVTSTTKISKDEAVKLADEHEFNNNEAQNMVNVSKEFVNIYLKTNRKLPFGGRETSDISIVSKPGKTSETYPKRVGVGEDGKPICQGTETKQIPPHDSAKVIAKCPEWVK